MFQPGYKLLATVAAGYLLVILLFGGTEIIERAYCFVPPPYDTCGFENSIDLPGKTIAIIRSAPGYRFFVSHYSLPFEMSCADR
jgi:hypothetical protein